MIRTSINEINLWLNQLHSANNASYKIHSKFIKPYQLLTLTLLLKKQNIKDFDITEYVKNYTIRMGVWEVAGLNSPHNIIHHNSKGKFLPITNIESEASVFESAVNLANIAIDNNSFLEKSRNDILIVLNELLGNCYHHSEREGFYGLACAQNWKKSNTIQISIIDDGIGIRESLRQNPELSELISNNNACEIASRFGITSKPEKGHAGYGLALARELTKHNKGNFILISGSEGFAEYDNKPISFDLKHSWKGTMLIIEWNTNNIINTKQVYDSWPLPRGFTDDDFDI